MKSRILARITAITLFSALAILPQLAAQEPQQQAPTFTVLYTFPVLSEGSGPGVIFRDNAGNLYGATGRGGSYKVCINHQCIPGCQGLGCGMVFKLDTTGNLYGTTFLGGSTACGGNGCGIIFKIDTTGNETVLHSFVGSAGGWYPSGGLLRDAAGDLYGTTVAGGDLACQGIESSGSGCGVVFKLDTTGKETVLHRFTGRADGAAPTAGLVQDNAGNLYGTTVAGGQFACPPVGGCGVIFKLDTTGHETVLHRFTGADGRGPFGGLLRDATGNLYGATGSGGDLACPHVGGCGVVFKLDTTGKETVLHSFTGGADGWYPIAGLIQDAGGNLYGTTSYGGQLTCPSRASGTGCGVIFKFAP